MGLLWGTPEVTGGARQRDSCWERGGGAIKLERHDVMLPSSNYCRHCDADGHHATVDTGIWLFRDTATLCVLAGGGACVTASSDMRVILA